MCFRNHFGTSFYSNMLRLPNILFALLLLRLPCMEDNISNLLACVIDARQPIQPILKQMGPGSKRGFSKVYEEMHSSRSIETLHGTLVEKLTVVGEGCDISIDYINPIPLLVHSCATSLRFFRLMQMCVSRAPGGVLRFFVLSRCCNAWK